MIWLLSSAPALIVAVGGVGIAWLWLGGDWVSMIGLAGVLVLGLVMDLAGRRLLPRRPVGAVRLMEWCVLVPGVLAVGASALIIVVAVKTSKSLRWGFETKALVAALTAALTTFLTTTFINGANSADSSWIAAHVMKQFHKRYTRIGSTNQGEPRVTAFVVESAGERWVFSDPYLGVSGWGHRARCHRASEIAKVLEQAAKAGNTVAAGSLGNGRSASHAAEGEASPSAGGKPEAPR